MDVEFCQRLSLHLLRKSYGFFLVPTLMDVAFNDNGGDLLAGGDKVLCSPALPVGTGASSLFPGGRGALAATGMKAALHPPARSHPGSKC